MRLAMPLGGHRHPDRYDIKEMAALHPPLEGVLAIAVSSLLSGN
jgi:hypothetical protein